VVSGLLNGEVAELKEQGTHKPLVRSSNLTFATFLFNVICPRLLMVTIMNSFPVPVCRFSQARGCKGLKIRWLFVVKKSIARPIIVSMPTYA
jgi:hypothetical protein